MAPALAIELNRLVADQISPCQARWEGASYYIVQLHGYMIPKDIEQMYKNCDVEEVIV